MSAGYGDHGYGGASGTSYWGMIPGHNCTNYAAYRLIRDDVEAEYLVGVDAIDWGHRALANGVAVNATPAVGAIAWWDGSAGSGVGHVAYVEQVAADHIVISEDNYGGTFHWRRVTPGIGYPTGFIHFTGTSSTERHIAWWRGDVVSALATPDFRTTSSTAGLNTGSWHDVMDYNGDGRDDIVLYRPADGSLRIVLKKASGGFSGYTGNPIRTGLGAPTWAGVADLDGDGRRDDIAWWQGDTVYALVGSDLRTTSHTSEP